jgi:hypothetical protein
VIDITRQIDLQKLYVVRHDDTGYVIIATTAARIARRIDELLSLDPQLDIYHYFIDGQLQLDYLYKKQNYETHNSDIPASS